MPPRRQARAPGPPPPPRAEFRLLPPAIVDAVEVLRQLDDLQAEIDRARAIIGRAARGGAGGAEAPGPAAALPAGLRCIHRKLLNAATADPVPTKKLITLAGYSPNTYSRDAVTHLCRQGLLQRTPDGIRLPNGPPGPAHHP